MIEALVEGYTKAEYHFQKNNWSYLCCDPQAVQSD